MHVYLYVYIFSHFGPKAQNVHVPLSEFRMDLDSRGPGLDFRYVDWTWTGPGLGLSPGLSPRKKFSLDKIDLDDNKIKIEFKFTCFQSRFFESRSILSFS